jgi:uncharacterized iron-regulated membrane protein
MIMKALIVIHRYVGVVLGVIMTMWCVSGFVMMYQGFPETSQEERLAGLAALAVPDVIANLPIEEDAAAGGLRIEMLNGDPVLRLGREAAYNLSSGAPVGALDEAGARGVARAFATGNGINGEIARLERIENDQWAVSGARQRPLYRAEFNDAGNTLVYVNGSSGEVVQDANSGERIIAWFGAIPHWLYPALLRTNQPLWFGTVVWLSAIGCFLVVTGMVIGFIRLRGKSGKWWPYRNRPMWMWHHVFGTFAGVLMLTWTFSGLLTMAPWGLFESEPALERREIASSMTWSEAQPVIAAAASDTEIANIVSLRGAPFMGQPYLIARMRDGSQVRIGANGRAPLVQAELAAGLQARGGVVAAGKLDMLTAEDDYYYGHKREVAFPVYRLVLNDADQTHVYFNATTGDARVVDATAKRYRWLENGLHSLDFSFLRARPLWDIVTLILMLAVTVACATGAWMSFTRIGQDYSRVKEFLRRK